MNERGENWEVFFTHCAVGICHRSPAGVVEVGSIVAHKREVDKYMMKKKLHGYREKIGVEGVMVSDGITGEVQESADVRIWKKERKPDGDLGSNCGGKWTFNFSVRNFIWTEKVEGE